jgi:hypothetical protein
MFKPANVATIIAIGIGVAAHGAAWLEFGGRLPSLDCLARGERFG